MSTIAKRHVLVVDDEPDFVAYVKTILDEDGFRVTTAFDGEDALARVRETPPDLVTLDISMPRKTGVLFYRQMKLDKTLCRIPVIVITGLRRTNAYAAPFIESFFEFDNRKIRAPEAYLDKPVERAALLSAVRKQLAGAETPEPAATTPARASVDR